MSLSWAPSGLNEFPEVRFEFLFILGPVVRTPVSANLGLNFNPGFVFFLSKAHSRIIFSILLRVSNHQIVDKENLTEFAF